jgi:hypothetical protein
MYLYMHNRHAVALSPRGAQLQRETTFAVMQEDNERRLNEVFAEGRKQAQPQA